MDSSCSRVHHVGKRIYISILELDKFAVVKNPADDRMLVFHLAQHIFTGGILSRFCFGRLVRNFHYVKQNFPDLFWRGYIELRSCHTLNVTFGFYDVFGELTWKFFKNFCIETDSLEFYWGENWNERHLHFFKKFFDSGLLQHGLQFFFELKCDIGIFSSVFRNFFPLSFLPISVSMETGEYFKNASDMASIPWLMSGWTRKWAIMVSKSFPFTSTP